MIRPTDSPQNKWNKRHRDVMNKINRRQGKRRCRIVQLYEKEHPEAK